VKRRAFAPTASGPDVDPDPQLARVLDELFSAAMTTARFDEIVDGYWNSGRFVRRLEPRLRVADRILRRAETCPASSYGADVPWVRFRSRRLFGRRGQPGAIHIEAPGERLATNRLRDKNRGPHFHLEGRIAIITSGEAVFYAHRQVSGTDCLIETPVGKDDVIFCPARVVHTFDAGRRGFTLCSAMGCYTDAAGESFAIPAQALGIDCDALPRIPYAGFVAGTARGPVTGP
jgi:hypothetical protein